MITDTQILDQIRTLVAKPENPPDEKIIKVTAEDRQRIEKALGKNFSTSKELADAVCHAMETKIDDIGIQLSPRLIDRLKTRSLGMAFEDFLPWLIKRELEEYAGLR